MKNMLKLTLATVLGLASVVAFAEGDKKEEISNKDLKIKCVQYGRDLKVKEAIDAANKAYADATKVEKDAKLDTEVEKAAAQTRDEVLKELKKDGKTYKSITEEGAKAAGLEAKDIPDTCTFCSDAKSTLFGTKTRTAVTLGAAAGIAGLGYYAYSQNQANQASE